MSNLYENAEISLSDLDVKQNLPNVKIVKYEELKNYNSIQELLPNKVDAIVNRPNCGHWLAILRNINQIHFFDSYGYRPDKQLLWTEKYMRKELNQDFPFLSLLLNKAVDDGFKVSFNEVQYQKKDDGINTCGRWVIYRIRDFLQNRRTPQQFKKHIESLIKSYELIPDLIITKLVNIHYDT